MERSENSDFIEFVVSDERENMATINHHLAVMDQSIAAAATNYSLKLSRQFISLLEDYRFLLTCFQNTCGCHANFDHQFFLRKLEERYQKLSDLADSDSLVSEILLGSRGFGGGGDGGPDDNGQETDDELQELTETILPSARQNETARPKFIHRIKVCDRNRLIRDRPRPSSIEGGGSSNSGGSDGGNKVATLETIKISPDSLKGAKTAYKCSYTRCDFISFTLENLLEHTKSHTSFDFTMAEVDKKGVVYVCEQCGKEFAGQKWLDNHIENTHSSLKMYSCDYPGCTYRSKFRCVAEDHKRRHSKIKEFKCSWEDCDAEFVTRRDMMAHINFYHKGIKNYYCTWPECDASFKDSNRLKHHFYIHTGERPYKCDAPGCDASFKQLPHLNKHKRIHLSDKTFPFGCGTGSCRKKFRRAAERQHHIDEEHYGQTEDDEEDQDNANEVMIGIEDIQMYTENHNV